MWLCAIILAVTAGICEARKDTAAEFLTFGVGARAAGMGEAFVAVADDSTAAYWNPAGLVNQCKGINAMHNNLYPDVSDDMFYDGITYACPVDHDSAIGVGAAYLNLGKHPITGLNPATGESETVGNFQASDMAVTMSYARTLLRDSGLSAGISMKYVSSKYYYVHAKTYAADFGVIYRPGETKKLRLGAVLKDWGSKIQYMDHYQADALPTTLKVGAAYQITDHVLFAADIIKPLYDKFTGVNLGVETALTNNLVGRVGWVNKEKGCHGLTYGAGIMFNKWQLDFANFPTGALGKTNRVSVGMKY